MNPTKLAKLAALAAATGGMPPGSEELIAKRSTLNRRLAGLRDVPISNKGSALNVRKSDNFGGYGKKPKISLSAKIQRMKEAGSVVEHLRKGRKYYTFLVRPQEGSDVMKTEANATGLNFTMPR